MGGESVEGFRRLPHIVVPVAGQTTAYMNPSSGDRCPDYATGRNSDRN